jgi:hypothetical protein
VDCRPPNDWVEFAGYVILVLVGLTAVLWLPWINAGQGSCLSPHFGCLEVRPNLGTASATRLADHQRLDIRKPYVIRPATGTNGGRVSAAIATDPDAARPTVAATHLAERDFLGSIHYPQI